MERSLRIGVVGAGLGGTTAVGLLQRAGFNVVLYDQMPAFSRLGAGIQLGPNVMKIMRRLGIEESMAAVSNEPQYWCSRNGMDGVYLSRIPLNADRARYQAPYITIHRGEAHQIMLGAVDTANVQFGKCLADLHAHDKGVRLSFMDGTSDEVDILIGADGLNSCVRAKLLGPEDPLFTGWIGHRGMIKASKLAGLDVGECVKWWSSDRHMMTYFLDRKKEEFYFVTGEPAESWPLGVSWVPSTHAEMHKSFAGYDPLVRAYIDAAENITKWPLYTRKPLPVWHRGRVVLLGDACHPMKPHMAQGAAMAIEDAAMLVRCMAEIETNDPNTCFEAYRHHRMGRASRVQEVSNANTWLRTDEDPSWVYGYDVYGVDLHA
ncbi:FAD-dependent monooxygenase [Komagataeibacter intermedius]|uniref:6-hydroxynicotinate 3-monooxygenase n=2 Tax=Komagataeibacter intermedius TaxID=66229 RepID=A0A0N1F793_9PROT|nr:FAD-dependent monooxygenase [Komagataeibacter intermedius]KPH85588.1 6-hydroxynicotinate 3-monooxygenase [Komagataeibacter intermedius AF2]MCF3637656.1 FAD-dependent monooxygenase [Komagataeibacter intermedius]GAN88073.1 salicylate 1-monooxygenase [Komagataeibacter intermedius TF2]GBQ77752.1 salicylate 1-monooxygenase [Komagataeibacter intermedius NRIC 0521]